MATLHESVKRILCEGEDADIFAREFSLPLLERYKDRVKKLADNLEKPTYKRLKNFLNLVEILVGLFAAVIGFYLTYSGASEQTKAVVWTVYVLMSFLILFTVRVLPQDFDQFRLEVRNLTLTKQAERLAAKVFLFDLLSRNDPTDDQALIERFSTFLPEVDTLSDTTKEKIRLCLHPASVFTFDAEETNVTLPLCGLTDKQKHSLQDFTQEIVMICGHLFAGRDFTAKIFLRTVKQYDGSAVEILTSFAKFPARGADLFGSSWVKARGNPSAVWTSLESGKPFVKSGKKHNAQYSKVLAICLPGRIGVLSLTSTQESAFKGFENDWTTTARSLAAATLYMTLSALEIRG